MRNLPSSSRRDVASKLGSVFYGWWLVGIGAFVLTLVSVTVFQGMGTFLVALQRQFGWSRTEITGAFSLGRVEGAVLGPAEGWLVDRLGTKRMLLIGYTMIGIGFVLLSRVTNLWQLYGAFFLIALGSGLGSWLAVMAMINNWFIRRRAFAMATAMSGIHLGGFLVPVLALGIDSHGFRMTSLGIGLFLLATVLPVTRIIRDRPEEYGLRPDGDLGLHRGPGTGAVSAAVDQEPDFTARQALRTPAFWGLTIVHTTATVSIVTLGLHLVPKLTDMGMSLSAAALIVLVYAAVALPTQFAAGYVADRLPKPPVIFAFLIIQSSGMLIIATAEDVYMALIFAVLFGIGFGGRAPLLTVIRGDYFGRKAFATIMGLSMLPNNLAMIGGPLFAAYMFDKTDSYFVPFLSFAVLGYVGAFLMLFVKRPKIAIAQEVPG